jgi:hypothetical protein
MAQSGITPFGDISNTIGTCELYFYDCVFLALCNVVVQRLMVALEGTQDTSNTTPHALDQKELKRQQERERYAGMSVEQKDEKNKKRPMSDKKRAEINKKRREARLMKRNVQAVQ